MIFYPINSDVTFFFKCCRGCSYHHFRVDIQFRSYPSPTVYRNITNNKSLNTFTAFLIQLHSDKQSIDRPQQTQFIKHSRIMMFRQTLFLVALSSILLTSSAFAPSQCKCFLAFTYGSRWYHCHYFFLNFRNSQNVLMDHLESILQLSLFV